MKIENLTIPKAFKNSKTVNGNDLKQDFSSHLNGAINENKEKNVQLEKIEVKVTDKTVVDYEVESNDLEEINVMLMFMNTPPIEEIPVDINSILIEDITDISISSNVTIDILDIPLDLEFNLDKSNALPVTSDLLTENIFNPEIKIENPIVENNNLVGDEKELENLLEVNKSENQPISNPKPSSNSPTILKDEEIKNLEDFKVVKSEDNIKLEAVLKDPTIEKEFRLKEEELPKDNKWLNPVETNQKISTVNVSEAPKVLSPENVQNINDSIIHLMETTTEGNTNIMKVQMYPEELGAVNITLKMENGKLIAKILVDDEYVKQLFTAKIEQLNQSFIKQNINMEEIFVELNSNDNWNNNSGQGNNSFKQEQNKVFKFEDDSMEQDVVNERLYHGDELKIFA